MDSSGDETEVLQFNLTDPDQLTEQLENAHLNEEETDQLLNEALKLNAQLKDVLRKQQLGEDQGPSSRAREGKQSKKGKPFGLGQNHPLAEQFIQKGPPKKPCLPPIGGGPGKGLAGASHGDRLASKSGKGSRTSGNTSPPRASQGGPRISSAGPRRKGSAKRAPVDNRPQWDDRFSYS